VNGVYILFCVVCLSFNQGFVSSVICARLRRLWCCLSSCNCCL